MCAAADMPEAFDANRDAKRKLYRYVIHDGDVPNLFMRRYCCHTKRRLDASPANPSVLDLRVSVLRAQKRTTELEPLLSQIAGRTPSYEMLAYVKRIADVLISTKGVKHGRLTITTSGAELK